MDFNTLRIFLSIVENGSISLTAEQMFLSQSTVSYQLKQLEKELGFKLIERSRGYRDNALTLHGHQFLQIARDLLAAQEDIEKLRSSTNYEKLIIGGTQTINNFSLSPLYRQIVEQEPMLKLSIMTYHSSEIPGLLDSHALDIGFVYSVHSGANLVVEPLFSEEFGLLCLKEGPYYNNISPEQLSRENEIYLKWSPEYERWHCSVWNHDIPPYVQVNTGSMLRDYFTRENLWAIAPYSVIHSLEIDESFSVYTLSSPPPALVCYKLLPKHPRFNHLNALELFNSYMTKFVADIR